MIAEHYDGLQEMISHEDFESRLEDLRSAEEKLNQITQETSAELTKKLLEDPSIKRVSLHKPGDEVTMKDGTTYVVQGNGSWKRKEPKVKVG